ncbi:MAG: FAD-dependent monooxygenase, partial [Plesiomonas shigelloides]
ISQAFPARLGEFEVLDKGAFALVRRHAQQYVLPGLALLGDAAHTINPLAGQGVNLGFKDVQALLEVLDSAVSHQEEIGSLAVLRRYECRRRPDNLLMQSGMDLFYGLFSNDLPPLRMLRNVGLMVADKSGVLKRQALRYALGL